MRAILATLTTALVCCSGLAICDTPEQKQKQETTVAEIDRQIVLVKDQIAKYNKLASDFDRTASNLQSHDFSGSRHAANVRDKIRTLSKDLQEHLQELEKARNEIQNQNGNSQQPVEKSQL